MSSRGSRVGGICLLRAFSSLLKNLNQNAIRATIESSGRLSNLSCVLGSVLESMLLMDPSKSLFQQTVSRMSEVGTFETCSDIRDIHEMQRLAYLLKRHKIRKSDQSGGI